MAGTLASKDAGWEPALAELRAFMKTCGTTPFDLVVNLTHTDMSALITSLVPARKRVGLVSRADRRKGMDSAWMTYLRASVRSRDHACFHLVDLFAWTAGIGRDAGGLEIDITPGDHAWAEGFLAEHALTGRPFIAMQLGASAESKQWPPERFAALADALDPSLGDIVLVGGPGERALAAAFQAVSRRVVYSSIGESSLRQLAALLQRARLLVTNDTGPMHVATAAGTRVVDLSSGPVSAFETGPYGEGHIVIEPVMACFPCPLDSECHHFACRTALTPEDAAAVVRYALDAGPAPVLHGARVLQARRTGRSGRIEFMPVSGAPALADRVRAVAAGVWEDTLKVPSRVGEGWPAQVDVETSWPDGDDDGREALTEQLLAVAREAERAAGLTASLLKTAPAKVQGVANDAHASLEKLLGMGESTRATHALVTYLRYEIESIAAADLAAMARAQTVAYTATAARVRLLADRLGVLTTS